ncbi:MAG: glycerol-3-phosphate dehydrogenase [Gammaproteobacteria bacterium]
MSLRSSWQASAAARVSRSGFAPPCGRCWVQDARLVVLNAMDALQQGAEIFTRTKCTGLTREKDHWVASLDSLVSEAPTAIYARAIVNAAGPWVEQVAALDPGSQSTHGVRLVKGSHIIVPSLFEHDYAYIFQNKDNRIMFAIPYESAFTLIGTTDVEIQSDPGTAAISEAEIDYLCENANQYFAAKLTPDDVVAHYAGVRPLFDDARENASKTTRDYVIHLDDYGPPVVSIYGGKLTTFRKLSEEVVNMLAAPLGFKQSGWTSTGVLPGGDFPAADFTGVERECFARFPWCERSLIKRFARNYGTKIDQVIGSAGTMEELGKHFGAGLYLSEVNYLIEREFAMSADDILVRRTKLGLHGGEQLFHELENWFSERAALDPVALTEN